MHKKAVKCLVTLLLVFLFSTVYCQTGFSDYTPMDPSGLPSFGEELVISNDTLIIIDEGETAVLAGNLTVLGTSDNVTNVQIIVNGTLIVNGTITCNRANFTLQNNGMLSMDNAGIINTGNSSIYLFNDETWTINATSLSTYAGSTYISNNGTTTTQEWKLLDQYDGTYIDNSGEGTFENCTITANGAAGAFQITNEGDLQFCQSRISANYGGTIDINNLFGTLLLNGSTVSASGWSHGKQSQINFLDGNTTWNQCSVLNNYANINFQNYETVKTSDCNVATVSSGTTNLSNSGNFILERTPITTSFGGTNFANNGNMSIIHSDFNCCGTINLYNTAQINADLWMVRCTCENGTVPITNANTGNIIFNRSFIENVTIADLSPIGAEGRTFTQATGGTITIVNLGTVQAIIIAIESCDAAGAKKDTFNMNQTVYVNGNGFPSSVTLAFYIVNDASSWIDGAPIPARVSGTAASVVSDDSGNVLVTVVWDSPLTVGLYDIIVDVNGNGHYDKGIDALDDNDMEVTAGFAVPEYPALSVLLLFMTATLRIGIVHKKRNVKS